MNMIFMRNRFTFLAIDLWIAKMSWRAGTLRLSVDHSTLRIKAANAML